MTPSIHYNLDIKENRQKRVCVPGIFNILHTIKEITTSVRLYLYAAVLIAGLLSFILTPCTPVSADDETTPKVTLVPGTGEMGVKLYVQLSNFGVKKGVIITFGGKTNVVDSVITNEDGSAIGSFTIDERAAGAYEVWADDGENEAWALFTIKPKIELSVTSSYVGDQVLATGYGFNAEKTATIYFDDTEISTCDIDERGSFIKIPFIIPEGANGKHTVRIEDSKQEFYEETFNIKPKIAATPKSGSVGSKVTVSGTGFIANGNIIIYFDDNDVTGSPVKENGSFSTTFTVPDCSTGAHKIKVDDSFNRYYADFSTEASITLKPTDGNIGTQLTIEGSGFKAETPTTITFDNIKIDIVTTTQSGSFFLKFNTPKSNHGAHTVTASDETNKLEAKFTIESTPPLAPTLLSPPDETRISKAIELDWSDVIDPSGIAYSLEISGDGEFSEILLSETGLEKSEFSLPENQETLPHRQMPYFWRVRAVDGASNVSEWSESGSFILGHNFASIISNMPGWTKYILIGLGLLVFAILFLWLGSRRKIKLLSSDTSEQDDEYQEQYEEESEYDDSILLPS